jgi:mobilome CxxCx(11)CxxC protein
VNTIERIKGESWDKAFHAYGTARIFEKRASRLGFKLRVLEFLGIAVPVTIGSTVLSLNVRQFEMFAPWLIWISTAITTIQLIGSIWALVSGWNNSYAFALEAQKRNARFRSRWERLTKAEQSENELKAEFDQLSALEDETGEQDLTQGITEKEKHFGMHESLFRYERPCAKCGIVPKTHKPSKCDCCGNY